VILAAERFVEGRLNEPAELGVIAQTAHVIDAEKKIGAAGSDRRVPVEPGGVEFTARQFEAKAEAARTYRLKNRCRHPSPELSPIVPCRVGDDVARVLVRVRNNGPNRAPEPGRPSCG